MTRILITVFLATIAATLILANDLNLGGPEPNDHSIKNASVIRKPKSYSQFAFVPFLGDGSNITSIRAVDHNVTNNASVSVVLGGIGRDILVLYFQAPRNRGLNFTVEVRGVPAPKPTPPLPLSRTKPRSLSPPESYSAAQEEKEEEPQLLNQVYVTNKFFEPTG